MISRGGPTPRSTPLRLRGPFAPRRSQLLRLWLSLVCLAAFPLTRIDAAGLTSPDPLVRAYELILDARFAEAERQLKTACGPAPAPACQVLGAVSHYWELLLDPVPTDRDADLMTEINASIASAEAWVSREPARAEAWFYLGGSYGTRVLLRGLREQYLSAARDGKRIHDSLQTAIRLDSTLHDAYFGLGLYHYYAAIAPTAARVLRMLLFLPAGDRAGGLKEMETTRSRGLLLRGEADYQLHLIYLWYERQPMNALRLVEGLRTRYPHNPVFALRLAAVQSDYLGNPRAALDTYRGLLDAARAGRVASPSMSEMSARLGMAQQMELTCDFPHAVEQLRIVIAQKPPAPYGTLALAHYRLGLLHDRTQRRSEAVSAYQNALATIPAGDRLRIGEKARAAVRRAPVATACR